VQTRGATISQRPNFPSSPPLPSTTTTLFPCRQLIAPSALGLPKQGACFRCVRDGLVSNLWMMTRKITSLLLASCLLLTALSVLVSVRHLSGRYTDYGKGLVSSLSLSLGQISADLIGVSKELYPCVISVGSVLMRRWNKQKTLRTRPFHRRIPSLKMETLLYSKSRQHISKQS
jgi:hypothetical protein